MIEHAFYFDSSACSGCKACQVACKDRHGLKVGLLWRRVYEVAGGGWTRSGQAWLSSVFAYHVSLACNHCVDAPCVEQCAVCQDVPAYAWWIAQGQYDHALDVILARNPLPGVTGHPIPTVHLPRVDDPSDIAALANALGASLGGAP